MQKKTAIKNYIGNIDFKQCQYNETISYFEINLSDIDDKWYKLGNYYNVKTKKPTIGNNVFFNRFLVLIFQNKLTKNTIYNYSFSYYKNKHNNVLTFTSFPVSNYKKNPNIAYNCLALDVYKQGFSTNDPNNFTQNDFFTKNFIKGFKKHRREKYNDEKQFKYNSFAPSGFITFFYKKNRYLLTDNILKMLIPIKEIFIRIPIEVHFLAPMALDVDKIKDTWTNEFIVLNGIGKFALKIYADKHVEVDRQIGLLGYQFFQILVT